jgi:hypothetical protein
VLKVWPDQPKCVLRQLSPLFQSRNESSNEPLRHPVVQSYPHTEHFFCRVQQYVFF